MMCLSSCSPPRAVEEDQLEGLQTGADAYILKPFNMDILRRTIINLLTMRRTLRNKFTGNESQKQQVEQKEIQTPDDALMQRIMEVINENIGDSDLSVDYDSPEGGHQPSAPASQDEGANQSDSSQLHP